MEIRQPVISSSRMEAIVTETQDEDLNKPATIGTVRMLAVHVDAGFTQLHSGLELLGQRIDGIEANLGQQIEHVEDKLTQRIDGIEANLGQRIDGVEKNLTQRIDGIEANLGQRIEHVEDKLTQRIDGIEANLGQRIDGIEANLGQRIDNSVIELKAQMSINMSTVMDQFALRSSSDRFIKVGFAVAVLGVLIQTAFSALK